MVTFRVRHLFFRLVSTRIASVMTVFKGRAGTVQGPSRRRSGCAFGGLGELVDAGTGRDVFTGGASS